jgi:predicted DNA-binding protein with PD1-like motif
MQSSEGNLGKIWVLRFKDNEPLPKMIEDFAEKKKIETAVVFIIGGTKSGKLIAGPKKNKTARKGVIHVPFSAEREMLGIGTLFKDEKGKISLHMHIAAGRNKKTLAGCIRAGIKVFLIAEAIILEIKGIKGLRKKDIATGFSLLSLIATN